MTLVIDASAAVEIVLQRASAERLTEKLLESDWVIAPKLFVAEVSNVFWKYQKFANYSSAECEKHSSYAILLADDFVDEIDYYKEALRLGCQLNHPIYGMFYLVLARRNNATLLTMDKKLLALATDIAVDV